MIKHILFDVDDVLIYSSYMDDNGNLGKFWRQNSEKDLGIKNEDWDRLFDSEWPEVRCGRLSLHDKLRRAFPNIPADKIISYWMTNDRRVNADMVNWVKNCKKAGKFAHLATNQEQNRTNMIFDLFKDIFDKTDTHFLSWQMGVAKPCPAFFETVIKTLAADPGTLLLIDDSAKNVNAAAKFGINTVQFDINNPKMIDILNRAVSK